MTLVLPVALGSLPVGATPVRFRRTRAPVAALGIQSPPSSSSVDWVKVTDPEFFQTDSRPIMLFDGNACSVLFLFLLLQLNSCPNQPLWWCWWPQACAICATVESDLCATTIVTGLMVLPVCFFVYPFLK